MTGNLSSRIDYWTARRWPNEGLAIARVYQLKQMGIWPGIWTDGTSWYLTYDPAFGGDDNR
jgi:hypothetical protein